MYSIIAYHGNGKKDEVEKDLYLLWANFSAFAEKKAIRHVYCFQSVSDNKKADLLLIIDYDNNNAAVPAFPAQEIEQEKLTQPRTRVDYWFYVRAQKRGNRKQGRRL